MIDHDEYAVNIIRNARAHFRLRRTVPQLWRHGTVCYPSIRVFEGMDDGVRLVAPGVRWVLKSHDLTVLFIANLGYSTEPTKSSKILDTSATQVIVRDSEYTATSALEFNHMYKVSAMKLFRLGTPFSMVNTSFATETKQHVDNFVQKIEDQNKGHAWLQIKPLIPPMIVRINKRAATPKAPVAREDKHTRYQKKKREAKKCQEQKRKLIELQKKRRAEQEEEKKRIQKINQACNARARRAHKKYLEQKVDAMNGNLQSLIEEKLEEKMEQLQGE